MLCAGDVSETRRSQDIEFLSRTLWSLVGPPPLRVRMMARTYYIAACGQRDATYAAFPDSDLRAALPQIAFGRSHAGRSWMQENRLA